MGATPEILEWHDDGHAMYLVLNREAVAIEAVTCPWSESNDQAPCYHRQVGCVVQWFLDTYGLDCNVGSVKAAWEVPIAWALQGDGIDLDLSQVWVLPTEDELYASWAADQRANAV